MKMATGIRAAFEDKTVLLPTSAIMPMRSLNKDQRRSIKFQRIAASIAEVGVIEPLVVSRLAGKDGSYLLLDGHARLSLLQELGSAEVRCLVALDDDPFTYNKRVSHLAIIQEHYMIMRALERGVTEKKIADALNVDVARIRRQRTLLDGICPEAVEMLKDRQLSPVVFGNLKKMASSRQVEVVGLMISCGNFSSSYASALLAGTRQQELAKPNKPKKVHGLSLEQMARMEHEMTTLQGDFKLAESSYGDHMLELVVASGYLSKLLRNTQVERYLAEHHSEFLDQFRAIVSSNVLELAA
jgi:ParB-like chromosome segregation protein Spo0J